MLTMWLLHLLDTGQYMWQPVISSETDKKHSTWRHHRHVLM